MILDQLKRWLPMFGGAWLAGKVLAAKLAVWLINFLTVMEWATKAQGVEKIIRAIGLDLTVATSMDAGAAALLVLGLAAKCWTLWRNWRNRAPGDVIADPARLSLTTDK